MDSKLVWQAVLQQLETFSLIRNVTFLPLWSMELSGWPLPILPGCSLVTLRLFLSALALSFAMEPEYGLSTCCHLQPVHLLCDTRAWDLEQSPPDTGQPLYNKVQPFIQSTNSWARNRCLSLYATQGLSLILTYHHGNKLTLWHSVFSLTLKSPGFIWGRGIDYYKLRGVSQIDCGFLQKKPDAPLQKSPGKVWGPSLWLSYHKRGSGIYWSHVFHRWGLLLCIPAEYTLSLHLILGAKFRHALMCVSWRDSHSVVHIALGCSMSRLTSNF